MSDHEHSITNSKMSKRQGRTEIGSARLNIFQVFNGWDEWLIKDPISQFVVQCSLGIQMLQFIALAYAPHYQYRAEVAKHLSYFTAVSLLPFWNTDFGQVDLNYFFIIIGVLVGALIVLTGIFIGYASKAIEQRKGLLDRITLSVAQALTTWLLQPALHSFMSPMVCSGGNVANFPETSCHSAVHIAAIAVCSIGLILLLAWAGVLISMLGDHDPTSNQLLATAHNYTEALTFGITAFLVIMYHILVAYDQSGIFNVLLIIGSVALIILNAYVLPHYHLIITKVRCGAYAVAVLAAAINICTAYADPWFVQGDVNSLFLLGLAPLVASLGFMLGTHRISSEFIYRYANLHQNAQVHRHHGRYPFPKGLMTKELRFVKKRYRNLESDILNEFEELSTDDQDPEAVWERQISLCSEVLSPAIEKVEISSDPEVAVRFLEKHRRITSLEPSAQLLAFAIRIYTKSLVLFRRSGLVRYAFANFLFKYASKLHVSLELIEEVEYEVGAQHDAMILFAAFKLGVRVKELFGLRDSSLLRTFTRAKQLHRDSLTMMTAFWLKLMDNKGDLVGLAQLTNSLTDRRRLATIEYTRALSDRTDRLLLTLYASFLDSVLMNPQKAQEFREIADDVAEAKKNSFMRGSRKKASIPNMASMDLEDDLRGEAEVGGGKSTHTLLRSLLYIVLIIVLCCTALFVIQVVRDARETERVDLIATASNVRASAERVVGKMLAVNRLRKNCGTGTCEDRTFVQTLYGLSGEDVAMRSEHNKYTYGAKRSAGAPVQQYLQQPTVTLFSAAESPVFDNSVQSREANPLTGGGGGFTDSGDNDGYNAGIFPELVIFNTWSVVHKLSTHISQYINFILENGDYQAPFAIIQDITVGETVSRAIDNAIIVEGHEVNTFADIVFNVSIGVFALMILLLGTAYAFFSAHMRHLAVNKTTTLSLFTLIPYPTQEMLHTAAKNKVEQFEHVHADEHQDDNEQGDMGDDDDHNMFDDDNNEPQEQSPAQKLPQTMVNDDDRRANSNEHRKKSGVSMEESRVGSGQSRLLSAMRTVVSMGALTAGGNALNAEDGDDDNKRKMSRFFGARPMSAQSREKAPTVVRSILKKPKTAAQKAQEKKAKEDLIAGKGRKTRFGSAVRKVRFNIGAEEEKKIEAHRQKQLKEPTINLNINEEDLIKDLNQSMKLADEEEKAATEKQKQKQEQEMNKLIHGGLRHTEHARQRRGNSSQSGDEATTARTFTFENVGRILAGASIFATAILLIVIFTGQQTLHTDATELVDREVVIFGTKSHLQLLSSLATTYSHFGRAEVYHQYFALLKTNRHKNVIDRFNYKPEDLREHLVSRLALVDLRAKRVIGGDMVCMAMASRGLSGSISPSIKPVDLAEVPLVSAYSWKKDVLTSRLAEQYRGAVDSPHEYVFPDLHELSQREVPTPVFTIGNNASNTVVPDAASLNITAPLTPAELHQLALRRLHSDRNHHDKLNLYTGLNETLKEHKESFVDEENTATNEQRGILIAALCTVIICVLANISEVYHFSKRHISTVRYAEPAEWTSVLGWYNVLWFASFIVVGILGIVATVYVGLAFNVHGKHAPTVDITDLLIEQESLQTHFMERRTQVSKYCTNATELAAFEIHAHASDIPERMASLYDNMRSAGIDMEQTAAKLTKAQVLAPLLKYQRLQKIGMFLAYAAANGATAPVANNAFGLIVEYDYSLEPDAEAEKVRYAQDSPLLQYTTSTQDLSSHTTTELSHMARFAAFGRRGFDALHATEEMFHVLFTAIETEGKQLIDDSYKDLEYDIVVAMSITVVAAGFYLLLSVFPKVLEMMRGSEESPQTEKRATEMIDTLYTTTIRKVRASLMILLILLIIQFILIALTSDTGHEATEVVATAYGREYHVSLSGTTAEKLIRALEAESFVEVSSVLVEMGEVEAKLSAARDKLYRSPESSSSRYGRVTTLSDAQNSVTFDETTGMDREFQAFTTNLRELSVSEVSLETSATLASQNAGLKAASGDNTTAAEYILYRPLTDTMKIDSTVKANLMAAALVITNSVDALMLNVKESNAIHLTDVHDSLNQSLIPDVILVICVILAGLLEIRFVFIPIANVVHTEQQGTMVMLRMIPPAVREMVPKIQMYLESGVLINEHSEKQAYTRSALVNSFIKKWQNGASESQCYNMFSKYENGIIIIDVAGTVAYMNDEVTALLDYSKKDLLGKNVKIIVDEPLRSLHDGFLKRFVQQGTSRIVGSGRDVLALNKAGQHVHVYLDLYEAARHTGDIYFVGELRRFDWQVAMGGTKAAKRMQELKEQAEVHRNSLSASSHE